MGSPIDVISVFKRRGKSSDRLVLPRKNYLHNIICIYYMNMICGDNFMISEQNRFGFSTVVKLQYGFSRNVQTSRPYLFRQVVTDGWNHLPMISAQNNQSYINYYSGHRSQVDFEPDFVDRSQWFFMNLSTHINMDIYSGITLQYY